MNANKFGIFYKQTTLKDAQSHLNMTNIATRLNSSDNIKDMGLINFYAQAMKSEVPLFKWSDFGAKNIIDHDGDLLKYKVATKSDNIIRIVKDLSNTDEPGADDSTFELMVDSDAFGPGTLLKPSEYSEFYLLVTPAQVRASGNNYIITVQFVSNELKFCPKEYLATNQPLGRFGSFKSSEYGQEWTPWKLKAGPSEKEYVIRVSNAEVNAHYWLSDKVCEFSDRTQSTETINLKNYYMKVRQYVKVDGIDDPTVPNLDSANSSMPVAELNDKLASGQASMAFAYLMDDISYNILLNDEQKMMMWSPGGLIKSYDGQEETQLPVGLWPQLKSGYINLFNINGFALGQIETGLTNYILGKRNFATVGEEEPIELETGRAGMLMMSKAIQEAYSKNGLAASLQLHNAEFGLLNGKSSSLGVEATLFTRFVVPGVFRVSVKHNPALDNTWMASELDNPNVESSFGSHRLSSYAMIAYNVNSKKDNIFIIRKTSPQVRHFVINGTESHPMYRNIGKAGFQNGDQFRSHLASTQTSGFGAFLRKPVSTVWVKDPTMVLMFLPYNPKTGKPFGNLE